MSPSVVSILPEEGTPTKQLRRCLNASWAFDASGTETILGDFVQGLGTQTGTEGAKDAIAAINLARQEEKVLEDLNRVLPPCSDIEELQKWWRRCIRYMAMFELIAPTDSIDPEDFTIKCSKRLQQRVGALIFAKLEEAVQHYVDICANQTPGSTFSILDMGKAIMAASKTHARPAPLETTVSKETGNLNMWFIMDAWDANSKVIVMNDPITTTFNFLDVYEKYLNCPALLILYVQVLRECSIAAANCLLQDKFMESEMPSVEKVGEYITKTLLPILKDTKRQWERASESCEPETDGDADGDANDDTDDKKDRSSRKLHWSRAKRCFACGSAEHALTNCTAVPPNCTADQLEAMRAKAVVPEGYKWRAAKTVLKMHKYSAVAKTRGEDKYSDPDDSFMSEFLEDKPHNPLPSKQ